MCKKIKFGVTIIWCTKFSFLFFRFHFHCCDQSKILSYKFQNHFKIKKNKINFASNLLYNRFFENEISKLLKCIQKIQLFKLNVILSHRFVNSIVIMLLVNLKYFYIQRLCYMREMDKKTKKNNVILDDYVVKLTRFVKFKIVEYEKNSFFYTLFNCMLNEML